MTSTLTARVLPYLPGTLIGGNGIDVIQAGTAFTIQWNPTEAGFSAFGIQFGGAANAAAAQALLTSTPLSWRNIIGANGGLEVWQRGAGGAASFAVSASTTSYTADRWYINAGVNQASTVTQVAGIVTGSRFAAKVQRNNAQTGIAQMQFGFPLDADECAMIQGQIVVISFTAKAGANFSPASGQLDVVLVVGTGSPLKFAGGGYTASTFPINVLQSITTTPTRYAFVSTLIPASTTQAEVLFQWTPVGTAGADDSFTIDDVQFEIGVTTQFERVPFEKMLLGCKRHFWKSFSYGTAPATNAGAGTGELQAAAGKTTAGGIFPRNPVSMRSTPSVTTFNPSAANAAIRDQTSGADTTGTAVANATPEGFQVAATGGIAAAGDTLGVHLTVDAGI